MIGCLHGTITTWVVGLLADKKVAEQPFCENLLLDCDLIFIICVKM